jgi:hypothetical protein
MPNSPQRLKSAQARRKQRSAATRLRRRRRGMIMNAKPENLIADMQSAIDVLESRLIAEMQPAIDALESRLNDQGYRLAAVEDQLMGLRDGLREEQWRPNPKRW